MDGDERLTYHCYWVEDADVVLSKMMACSDQGWRRELAGLHRCNYCLFESHDWVAFVEEKLLVVRMVVLGGQPVVARGERELLA